MRGGPPSVLRSSDARIPRSILPSIRSMLGKDPLPHQRDGAWPTYAHSNLAIDAMNHCEVKSSARSERSRVSSLADVLPTELAIKNREICHFDLTMMGAFTNSNVNRNAWRVAATCAASNSHRKDNVADAALHLDQDAATRREPDWVVPPENSSVRATKTVLVERCPSLRRAALITPDGTQSYTQHPRSRI